MADKISENSMSEIRKRGVPLRDAPNVFGATRTASKIRRKARQDASATTAMLKSSLQKMGMDWDAAYDGFEPSVASLNESNASANAKVEQLFERLRLGDLTAVGFPVHESDASVPVQVPPFMLERRFAKWGQDSFVGFGRRYARVVVCERSPEPTEVDAQPGPKRIGAPSFDHDLEAIARELDRRGVPLNPRPWKPLYFQVRSLGIEMKLPNFNDQRPDDETIRRFFFKRAATKPGLETQ